MEDTLTPAPASSNGGAMTMSFFNALHRIYEGKKVRRISWRNKDYCLMKDFKLTIFTNNSFHGWLINDGDMDGQDWIVITEPN